MTEQEPKKVEKTAKEGDANNAPNPTLRPDKAPQSGEIQNGQEQQAGSFAEQIKHTDRIIARSAIVTAILTFVLAVLAGLQAYSFIESERAFLVVKDIHFKRGDPTSDADGYDTFLTIKNVGKHTAIVSVLNVKPSFYIVRKTLQEIPPYEGANIDKVVPPIVPDETLTVNASAKLPEISKLQEPDRLAGVLSGDIPLRIFGFIDYDIGYPWWRNGRTGFCQEYIPKGRRQNISFETCDSPAYTYTR